MEWIRRGARRLRLLLRRDAVEAAMRDEVAYHIERETAERIRLGMPPDAARRAALLAFGGVERVKEEARDARGGRTIEDVAGDLRYALRVLRRNPAFTAAAVLTFALGIGAATAIFSITYGVVLRPLPYADPDRLVVLWERNVPRNRDRNVVSVENFEAWRDRMAAFEGMAALVPRPVTLLGGAAPERLSGAEVTPGYFELLGVRPLHGRGFTTDEGAGRSAPVVVLSHGLWTTRFGGDPAAVGRTLPLAGEPHTIVGVMPHDFDPPQFGWLGSQDLWFPFAATEENRAWGRFLLVVARLKPDVSLDGARAALDAVARQRAEESPGQKDWRASIVPLTTEIIGDVRVALRVLLGAVGLLLLIAAVNVATLTLSSLRRRAHELAIRRALGADDARLFRQNFVQSATIGVLGAAAGVLAAFPLLRLLQLWLPADLPRAEAVAVDTPVLVVSAAGALGATLLFGWLTARHRGRAAFVGAGLREPAAGRATPRSSGTAIVVTEMALAVSLSVMAILMARSVVALQAVDLGFAPGGVVAARLALPSERYSSGASQASLFNAVLERARTLPGVESAGLISTRPLGGLGPATSVSDAHAPWPADTPKPVADIRYATPEVFDALGVPLVRGAIFDGRIRADAAPQVVISAATAAALWPGGDAIGRHIEIGLSGGITGEVVGVVGDVHLLDLRTPPRPTAYLQASRFPAAARDLIVRVDGDPNAVIPDLRALVAELDPALPLFQVATLEQLVTTALGRERFTALVLGAFAGVALTLAAVGIFGVFSHEIAGRRKELGIRLALGATEGQLIARAVGRSLRRALLGLAAGGVLAYGLARGMASLLFGVEPYDPLTFAAVGLLLLATAAAATLLPAVRILGAAPLAALREG